MPLDIYGNEVDSLLGYPPEMGGIPIETFLELPLKTQAYVVGIPENTSPEEQLEQVDWHFEEFTGHGNPASDVESVEKDESLSTGNISRNRAGKQIYYGPDNFVSTQYLEGMVSHDWEVRAVNPADPFEQAIIKLPPSGYWDYLEHPEKLPPINWQTTGAALTEQQIDDYNAGKLARYLDTEVNQIVYLAPNPAGGLPAPNVIVPVRDEVAQAVIKGKAITKFLAASNGKVHKYDISKTAAPVRWGQPSNTGWAIIGTLAIGTLAIGALRYVSRPGLRLSA